MKNAGHAMRFSFSILGSRFSVFHCLLCTSASLWLISLVTAADVESRRLTHYLAQDFLEKTVRTEGWAEVVLDLKDGLHKGDVVRVWAGGSIDRGDGERPGAVVNGPEGSEAARSAGVNFALSPEPAHAYAVLFKTEASGAVKCLPPGKPLEIKVTKDKERLWIGFNDERGHFQDNHLGKGRRHELDPLWIRIEVVRIVVD